MTIRLGTKIIADVTPNATTETAGKIKIATSEDVSTGTNNTKAVTPAQLSTKADINDVVLKTDVATSSTKGVVQPDNTTIGVNNGIVSIKQGLYNKESLIPDDISSTNLHGFTVTADGSDIFNIFNKENTNYPRWQLGVNVSESNRSYTILFPDDYSLSEYTVENYCDGTQTGRIVTAWTLEYTTDNGTTWTTCDTVSGVTQTKGALTTRTFTEIQDVNGVRFTATDGGADGYSSVGRTNFYGRKTYTNALESFASKSLSNVDNIRTARLSERNSKLPANCAYVAKSQVFQPINNLGNVSGTEQIFLNNFTSIYKIQPTADTTLQFSYCSTNEGAYTFELYIHMPTVYSITWPSNISWGTAGTPTMSTAGDYFFAFRTMDRGANWIGNMEGRW